MKEFFEIMAKDILKENVSRRELVVYGVIAPVALVAFLGLVSLI